VFVASEVILGEGFCKCRGQLQNPTTLGCLRHHECSQRGKARERRSAGPSFRQLDAQRVGASTRATVPHPIDSPDDRRNSDRSPEARFGTRRSNSRRSAAHHPGSGIRRVCISNRSSSPPRKFAGAMRRPESQNMDRRGSGTTHPSDLAGLYAIADKKIFGRLAFFAGGHMCCGVIKQELMLRVRPEQYEDTLAMKPARPIDFVTRGDQRPYTGSRASISAWPIRRARTVQETGRRSKSWQARAIAEVKESGVAQRLHLSELAVKARKLANRRRNRDRRRDRPRPDDSVARARAPAACRHLALTFPPKVSRHA
jgi:hypothetical protein